MRFRGGGVGHISTRDATKHLLLDQPYEELQNIDTLEDIVEDEFAEDELPVDGEPPEDTGEGELPSDGSEGEDEQADESQHGSKCGVDYDDL